MQNLEQAMADKQNGQIITESEQWFRLTLREITGTFGVSQETIIEIVEEGIVTVEKNPHNELLFDPEAFRRIRTVLKLHNDLGVNLAGAGLALELLSEIERLRARLPK